MNVVDITTCTSENELLNLLDVNKLKIMQNRRSALHRMIIKIQERNINKVTNKLLSQSELACRAGIDSTYITKIINGTRHPTKYTWFRIGITGEFTLAEMEEFMQAAGFALDPNFKPDIILIYAVKKKLKLREIYELLEDAQVEPAILLEFDKGYM
jgi:transcriptional regulator with XRE-family HTH domain